MSCYLVREPVNFVYCPAFPTLPWMLGIWNRKEA